MSTKLSPTVPPIYRDCRRLLVHTESMVRFAGRANTRLTPNTIVLRKIVARLLASGAGWRVQLSHAAFLPLASKRATKSQKSHVVQLYGIDDPPLNQHQINIKSNWS